MGGERGQGGLRANAKNILSAAPPIGSAAVSGVRAAPGGGRGPAAEAWAAGGGHCCPE